MRDPNSLDTADQTADDWFASNAPGGSSGQMQPTADTRSDPSEIKKRFPTIKDYLAAFFGPQSKNYGQADWDKALGYANSLYGLGSGNEAKWYADTKTIGLPEGYYSQEPDGSFKWNERGPETGSVGTVGDLVNPYPKDYKGFYGSDFFLPRQTKPFVLPTGQEALDKDPGYGFRLGQGQRAIEQSAAARGLLNSGGNLKDILSYGQSLGSQEYDAAVGRAYKTWDANRMNDNDYNTWAWNQFLRSQDQYSGWQDRAFDKYYKTANLGATTSG